MCSRLLGDCGPNIAGQETMFPQQCFLVCPGLKDSVAERCLKIFLQFHILHVNSLIYIHQEEKNHRQCEPGLIVMFCNVFF